MKGNGQNNIEELILALENNALVSGQKFDTEIYLLKQTALHL